MAHLDKWSFDWQRIVDPYVTIEAIVRHQVDQRRSGGDLRSLGAVAEAIAEELGRSGSQHRDPLNVSRL